MKRPDYCDLPWRAEEYDYGTVSIFDANGGVLLSDSSYDAVEGIAAYVVHCVNTHDDLLAACEAMLSHHLDTGQPLTDTEVQQALDALQKARG